MRLLILGTGGMARLHALGFKKIEGVTLAGGVDTDPTRLATFCETHGIERGFSSLEAALEWGEFDAVSNVTPDSVHYVTTMAALRAGKHVLCEKPLATDHAKAFEMTELAESLGLVNMVNLSYRNVPQIQEAHRIVAAGKLGNVKHFEASYLQSWLVSKAWGDWRSSPQWLWRLSREHGSNGVLGDIGVHILDFVSYVAGSEFANVFFRLKTFEKAEDDRVGDYKLDANDTFVMTAELDNGAMGVINATRWATGHFNDLRLRIYGELGALEVTDLNHQPKLMACLGEDAEAGVWREIAVEPVPTNYERFVDAVRTGQMREPSFRHAALLQQVIDMAASTDRQRGERSVAAVEEPVPAQ